MSHPIVPEVAFAFSLLSVALLRRPGIFMPATVSEMVGWRSPIGPCDEEDQLPETDRTPRRHRWAFLRPGAFLPVAALVTFAVRVGCLVALGR